MGAYAYLCIIIIIIVYMQQVDTPDVARFVDRRSGLLQHLACHGVKYQLFDQLTLIISCVSVA